MGFFSWFPQNSDVALITKYIFFNFYFYMIDENSET